MGGGGDFFSQSECWVGVMRIQERDKEIIRRIYEQQFLFHEHVERYFFRNASSQLARIRIAELAKVGLLRKETVTVLGNRRIIRLTPDGLELARQLHHFDIPQLRRLDLKTVEHDAIVTSVALRLHELWDGLWVPERALKKEDYTQIPDGVFVFQNSNKVALEIENSLKGRNRFLENLDKWRFTPMRLVLFVTTHPKIHSALKRFIDQGPGKVPFALVDWDQLKNGTPTVWCPKGELQIFDRRQF